MKKLTAFFLLICLMCTLLAGCGILHIHTYDMDYYVYDVSCHWHQATCEHQDAFRDKEEHIFDALSVCTVCGYNAFSYLYPFYSKPQNSHLDHWITDDASSIDFSGYTADKRVEWVTIYYSEGYRDDSSEYIAYDVSAYPDYSDEGLFITGIYVTDPTVEILGGLTASASVDKWDDALKKLNFSMCDTTDAPLDEGTEYKKLWESNDGRVNVTLAKTKHGYMWNIDVYVSNRNNMYI